MLIQNIILESMPVGAGIVPVGAGIVPVAASMCRSGPVQVGWCLSMCRPVTEPAEAA